MTQRLARRTVRVPGFTLLLGSHRPGSELPRHTHDVPTLCFVLRGGFVEYSGGEAADCGPDTVKVMPAGEPHSNRFGRLETRGLRVDVDPERFSGVPAVRRALDERHRLRGGRCARIARRLVAELLSPDEAAPVAAEAHALELMAELGRALGPTGRGDPPAWLRHADDILHAGFRSRLTVAEIAAAVGVHAATLSRAYRARYGCSIGERVRGLRVHHAARELAETNRALSDIALDVGFYDQSHFTNVFRRGLGLTPGAYRAALSSSSPSPQRPAPKA